MLDVEYRGRIVTGLELAGDGPCRVSAVAEGSPAAAAGVRPGDVIGTLAGTPTPSVLDFHLALIGRTPEETIALALTREGQTLNVSLALGRRPPPDGAALLKQKLGLTAVALDANKAKEMLLRVARGVVVTAVEPQLYAQLEHKPEPGDVLARIGAIRPRDLEHAGLLLEKVKPGDRLPLVLVRHRNGVATRIDLSLVLPQ